MKVLLAGILAAALTLLAASFVGNSLRHQEMSGKTEFKASSPTVSPTPTVSEEKPRK